MAIGYLPLGFGVYFLPALIGVPLVTIRGRCRRIGIGLSMSLLTVPFAVMGIVVVAAVHSFFYG